MTLTHKELLMKLGAARSRYPAAWRLVEVKAHDQEPTFTYRLKRDKLKQVRRREGRYLLRTNLIASDPAELWRYYIQLTQVEEAFKNLKGDLAIRPVYHQKELRIEAQRGPFSFSATHLSRSGCS
jgi:transposase